MRLLGLEDADALLDYYVANREHLRPWVPALPEDFFSLDYQKRRMENYLHLAKRSEEFRFAVLDGETMAASINLTAVEYGAFLNGRLGYSVGCDYVGKGVATKYIGVVCEFALERLTLHRIEANVMPRNIASRRVLEKCGFQKVGFSPKMVQIAGVWEDHDMFARVREE